MGPSSVPPTHVGSATCGLYHHHTVLGLGSRPFDFFCPYLAGRPRGRYCSLASRRWCRLPKVTNRLPKHVTIVFFFVVVVLGGPGGPEKRDGGSGHSDRASVTNACMGEFEAATVRSQGTPMRWYLGACRHTCTHTYTHTDVHALAVLHTHVTIFRSKMQVLSAKNIKLRSPNLP